MGRPGWRMTPTLTHSHTHRCSLPCSMVATSFSSWGCSLSTLGWCTTMCSPSHSTSSALPGTSLTPTAPSSKWSPGVGQFVCQCMYLMIFLLITSLAVVLSWQHFASGDWLSLSLQSVCQWRTRVLSKPAVCPVCAWRSSHLGPPWGYEENDPLPIWNGPYLERGREQVGLHQLLQDEDGHYSGSHADVVWSLSAGLQSHVSVDGGDKILYLVLYVQLVCGFFLWVFQSCCVFVFCSHFKRYLNIILEFVPQVLFLLCIFGWLVFLIFFKWCFFYEIPGHVRTHTHTIRICINLCSLQCFNYEQCITVL